jgi:hypothetical protein
MADAATTQGRAGRPAAYLIGRVLGALGALGATALWVFALWFPGAAEVFAGSWSVAIGLLMLIVALLALIAAYHGHGNLMLAMFLASFLPIGAFMLYANHWLRWSEYSTCCCSSARC